MGLMHSFTDQTLIKKKNKNADLIVLLLYFMQYKLLLDKNLFRTLEKKKHFNMKTLWFFLHL